MQAPRQEEQKDEKQHTLTGEKQEREINIGKIIAALLPLPTERTQFNQEQSEAT
jgi:hypothetical protein